MKKYLFLIMFFLQITQISNTTIIQGRAKNNPTTQPISNTIATEKNIKNQISSSLNKQNIVPRALDSATSSYDLSQKELNKNILLLENDIVEARVLDLRQSLRNMLFEKIQEAINNFYSDPLARRFLKQELINSIHNKDKIVLNLILDQVNLNFLYLNENKLDKLIELDELIEALEKLIEEQNINLVKRILEKISSNTETFDLLKIATKKGYDILTQLIIDNEKFNFHDPLVYSINTGNEKLMKMLMSSKKLKYNNDNFNFYLTTAAKNNQKGIIHILKAYDALKTDIDFKKTSLLDIMFYDAYQEFIKGNANDLRNLIFPVSKKINSKNGTTSYTYAIFPKENSESAAMMMISKSLVKLFKPGYIRSLILTLIETNAQKEAAQNLLEQMKLTKEDLKEFFKDKKYSLNHQDHDKAFDFYSYLDTQDDYFYNSNDSDH